MRAKDGDRLDGMNQQRLVVLKRLEALHNGVEAFPVSGGLAGAAVDHQILRALSHVGVEVVHEHAQSGFLLPAFTCEGVAAWSFLRRVDRSSNACGHAPMLVREPY